MKWFVHYVQGEVCCTGTGCDEFETEAEARAFIRKLMDEDSFTDYILIEGKKIEEN